MSRLAREHLPPIFFRADDIGIAGQAFVALSRLFRHYQIPLAMAVVPAWLSDARQDRLFAAAPVDEDLWSWHQHGWRHVNWQKSGQKCEFGSDRTPERQYEDILQGRQKMENIFGSYFVPVFTPPWNRFSAASVKILQKLGFRGISTEPSLPSGLRLPAGLNHLPVQLDLHFRTPKAPAEDFADLLRQISSLCDRKEKTGIVIHHQRMTPFAFEFLEHLLYNLKHVSKARFFDFKEIFDCSDEKKAGARLR
ncbi:MAG: polysaccharide deacetylase family protein [Desulfobacteraceae bacterium]|nr:polysaccharide deacetylase family protein [Desulfobacteraceae bacterium]